MFCLILNKNKIDFNNEDGERVLINKITVLQNFEDPRDNYEGYTCLTMNVNNEVFNKIIEVPAFYTLETVVLNQGNRAITTVVDSEYSHSFDMNNIFN